MLNRDVSAANQAYLTFPTTRLGQRERLQLSGQAVTCPKEPNNLDRSTLADLAVLIHSVACWITSGLATMRE